LRPQLETVTFYHDMVFQSERYGSRNSKTYSRSHVLVQDHFHSAAMQGKYKLIFKPDERFSIPATVLTYIRVRALTGDITREFILDFALVRLYTPHIDRFQHPYAEAAEIWSCEIENDLYGDKRTLFAVPIKALAGKFVPGIFDDTFKFTPYQTRESQKNRKTYASHPSTSNTTKRPMTVLRLGFCPVDDSTSDVHDINIDD